MTEIRFDGVTHAYGDRLVLRGITAVIGEHAVGIVGGNGSGKSTLARMINGLVSPTGGRVTVDGLDVARHGRDVRKKVGFVFTDADTQIVMPTVGEDVAFSLRRSGLAKAEVAQRVSAALESMGLGDFADHPAHLLSGGQKQLLALAAVLVREPAIVVADEPTTLLDRRNARRVGDLLAALPQQIVVVTHQLSLLERFDRVLVIDDGRIACDDVPARALAFYRDLADADGPSVGAVTDAATEVAVTRAADAVATRPAAEAPAIGAPRAKRTDTAATDIAATDIAATDPIPGERAARKETTTAAPMHGPAAESAARART